MITKISRNAAARYDIDGGYQNPPTLIMRPSKEFCRLRATAMSVLEIDKTQSGTRPQFRYLRAMRMKLSIVLGFLCAAGALCASENDPETVYIIFSIKQGHEKQFEQVNQEAWAAYQRLGLVFNEPHVSAKGTDQKNRPFVVDIMTWKNHSIPDNIPTEIEPIWAKMRQLCEGRDGRDGIDFTEVQPLSGEPR